ncbi:MAG: RNA polymerase sigma factor [Planctomycetota bacterium]
MRDDGLTADDFTSAFARHGRALWLLASAWVGRSSAEDLVQETARVAWERRTQARSDGEILPWLAQITRHLAANWRRKRGPIPTDPSELPDPVDESTAAEDSVFESLREHLPDEITRALSSLAEIARATLLLRVVGELPFSQIAAMLGIPENTAVSHARRARNALRSALAPAREFVPPRP